MSITIQEGQVCRECEIVLTPENAYRRSGRKRGYYLWCKPCDAARVRKRAHENKLRAVAYLGGKCSKCGYDRCVGALEFHRRDRSTKQRVDKSRAVRMNAGWATIKAELDKCDLVCSNCHKEIEEELALL